MAEGTGCATFRQDTVEVSVTKYTMLNPADKVLPFYPNSRDSVSSQLFLHLVNKFGADCHSPSCCSRLSQPTRPFATNTGT